MAILAGGGLVVVGIVLVAAVVLTRQKPKGDEAVHMSYDASQVQWKPAAAANDKEREMKCIIKIQALYRGWKARRMLRKKVEEEGLPRPVADKQRVCLQIEVVKGDKMPDINTFGGCDPMVELRIAPGGDPLKRTDVPPPLKPSFSVLTQAKMNDKSPQWAEKLELKDCSNLKDTYFQVILWDYNMTGNCAIGHTSMTIAKALDKLAFKVKESKPEQNKFRLKMRSLLGPDNKEKFEPTVDIKMNFVEVVKLNIDVVSASKLPRTKTIGTINSYIELRLVQGSPRRQEWSRYPNKTEGLGFCYWSNRTDAVADETDPNYKKVFEDIEVIAYNDLFLQIILWDSNAPLLDTPVCHTEIAMKEIVATKPGGNPIEHQLKFSRIDGADSGIDFKKAKLKLNIGFKLAFDA